MSCEEILKQVQTLMDNRPPISESDIQQLAGLLIENGIKEVRFTHRVAVTTLSRVCSGATERSGYASFGECLHKYRDELIVFWRHKEIPATNNHAESELRFSVKIRIDHLRELQ